MAGTAPAESVAPFQKEERTASPVMLAVGTRLAELSRNERPPVSGSVVHVEFSDISSTLIESLRPSLVLTPLLSRWFDCIELAQRLSECGYSGSLHILADGIPRPQIVLNEVREVCPDLAVQIDEPMRLAV